MLANEPICPTLSHSHLLELNVRNREPIYTNLNTPHGSTPLPANRLQIAGLHRLKT
jgi:hypothetical protein